MPRIIPDAVDRYMNSYMRARRAISFISALGWAVAFFLMWLLAVVVCQPWLGIERWETIAGGAIFIAIIAHPAIALFRPYDPVMAAMEIECRQIDFDQRLITVASQPEASPLLDQILTEVEAITRRQVSTRLVSLRPLLAPFLAVMAAALLTIAFHNEKRPVPGPTGKTNITSEK